MVKSFMQHLWMLSDVVLVWPGSSNNTSGPMRTSSMCNTQHVPTRHNRVSASLFKADKKTINSNQKIIFASLVANQILKTMLFKFFITHATNSQTVGNGVRYIFTVQAKSTNIC